MTQGTLPLAGTDQPEPKADPMLVRSTFLAEVLGVDSKQLTRLARRGMPKRGRNQWHLGEAVQWLIDDVSTETEVVTDERNARQELAEAQTERVRLEIDTMTGELYPADEVHAVLERLAGIFRDALNTIPARAAVFAHLDPAELEQAVSDECAAAADMARAAIRAAFEGPRPRGDVSAAPEA